MGQKRKLRILMGILRDKVSLIKVTLSLKRTASAAQLAVLRATAAGGTDAAPSEKRLGRVLLLGHGSRFTACLCIEALMDRLHSTGNDVFVALKCLITLHNVVAHGSFILRDQLSYFPSNGGRNFLNLSRFRDDSDHETWTLSSWVRWYADYLEQTMIASRSLGFYLCDSSGGLAESREEKITALANSDLSRHIDELLKVLEQICVAPDPTYVMTNNLVNEVLRLVGDDYGLTRSEISLRLTELGERLQGLSYTELTQSLSDLVRLENCKEKLISLFGNRKNSDGLWDTAAHLEIKMSKLKEQKEGWKLVKKEVQIDSAELARLVRRFTDPQALFAYPPTLSSSGGGGFMGLDMVPVTVPTVG